MAVRGRQNVWKEQARDGNHLNFLTGAGGFLQGAGGFLQNVMQGYGGLRARSDRVDWNPLLPPHISTVRFVRLSYAGSVYSLSYTATQATLEVHSGPSLSVCSPIGSSGPQDCFAVGAGAPATLSVGGFSLRLASSQ
jgi:trehalose/maltose hydrolase-like predicted phosphorylase